MVVSPDTKKNGDKFVEVYVEVTFLFLGDLDIYPMVMEGVNPPPSCGVGILEGPCHPVLPADKPIALQAGVRLEDHCWHEGGL